MRVFKRHVGRPTKKEVELRKSLKVMCVSLLISVVTLLISFSLITLESLNTMVLKGEATKAKSGKTYLWVSIKNSKISVDKNTCSVVIPFELDNKDGKNDLIITKIEIYKIYNNDYSSTINKEITLSKGSKSTKKIKIPIDKYKNIHEAYYEKGDYIKSSYKYIIYFKRGEKDKLYKVTEESSYDMYKAKSSLKECDEFKLELSCPDKVQVNKEFTCKTNVVGAKITVDKYGLAKGYNASFTTTRNDKSKQTKYINTGSRQIFATYKNKKVYKIVNVVDY